MKDSYMSDRTSVYDRAFVSNRTSLGKRKAEDSGKMFYEPSPLENSVSETRFDTPFPSEKNASEQEESEPRGLAQQRWQEERYRRRLQEWEDEEEMTAAADIGVPPRTIEALEKTTESDILGRIVVAAGIFLLLFLTGRFLKEPSQELVKTWISSNSVYEAAVEQTAVWIENRWEGREEAGRSKEEKSEERTPEED